MTDAKTIGRRDFGGALTCALLMLSGCGEGGNGPSVDGELSALAGAISTLSSTVARFRDDDWKDVVPDVQSDTSDVVTALANLKAAMGKEVN